MTFIVSLLSESPPPPKKKKDIISICFLIVSTWYMVFCLFKIVYQKGIDLYILFTRWGRIGDSGQYQHTPFHAKSEAVAEFCKVFKSKTGNTWASVKR